jgi:hypothetical protein
LGKRHDYIPGSETDREGRDTLTLTNIEDEEKKQNSIQANWRQTGCMTHGRDNVYFTLYLCRFEQCRNIQDLPLYCEICVERGEIHSHKNHFLADEAGILAYNRGQANPQIKEKYAEMSEQSLDTKERC